jgi:hypothetical protein
MRAFHVTAEVLDRFARGDLDDRDLMEVLHHLENCESCARAGEARAAGDLSALRTEMTTELPARRPAFAWALPAAAAIAIAITAALLRPRDRAIDPVPPVAVATASSAPVTVMEPPAPPAAAVETIRRPEWQRIVDEAVASGRLAFPAELAALQAPFDTVRGGTGREERVSPAAVIVDEVRPTFTWPSREGGTYTLFVFDDEREVLRSGPLQDPRWTPARDLPRDRTLTWQVEVSGPEPFETIPSPPSPPAMFRIVSEREHQELAEARERHGRDDLLLAVLYARSGMRAEAMAALTRAAAANDAAKRILDHETSTAR